VGRFPDLDQERQLHDLRSRDGLANALASSPSSSTAFATGKFWPGWYDEGRAAWFGSAEYATVAFDGTT